MRVDETRRGDEARTVYFSVSARAFERAFGESVVAFEARFERWRLESGLPPR